jgi:hypothetical protein
MNSFRSRYSGWSTKGSEFEFQWGQELLFLHVLQIGSGAHTVIQWVPGVKRPGREADHLPPTSAEVKQTWVYTSTPPNVIALN